MGRTTLFLVSADLCEGRSGGLYYLTMGATRSVSKIRYTGLAPISAFNHTPGEERGVYLSETEKDEVVATNRIPDVSRLPDG